MPRSFAAGDLSAPGDLAVFIIYIHFRHGNGIGIPVDIRHDHRVLIPTHADVIADAQLVKVIKLRNRCIVAEQQVTDEGSVAEALRFVFVLREEIIHQTVINVAVSVTINRMVARRVCNAHGNFVCRHFACVHTDMVPVHAVWKIIFKQLKPCLHALLRKIAAGNK